jgi:hypothetical protein
VRRRAPSDRGVAANGSHVFERSAALDDQLRVIVRLCTHRTPPRQVAVVLQYSQQYPAVPAVILGSTAVPHSTVAAAGTQKQHAMPKQTQPHRSAPHATWRIQKRIQRIAYSHRGTRQHAFESHGMRKPTVISMGSARSPRMCCARQRGLKSAARECAQLRATRKPHAANKQRERWRTQASAPAALGSGNRRAPLQVWASA